MRRFLRAVSGLAVLLLAPVLALATLAGVASVSANPSVYSAAALAVFCAIFLLGLLLCVPRPALPLLRTLRALALLGLAALVGWQVTHATLNPVARAAPLPSLAGQQQWELPTGSRLAYVRHAPGEPRPEPVVFLHGRPDLAGDSRILSSLRADGHAVYLYDRVGVGRSARLEDPSGYGLARDVEDLEAIRHKLRAARLTLVAHAEGTRVAAAYLSKYPDKVARLALSSPVALDTPPTLFSSLDTAQSGRLAWSMLHPRSLAIDTLAQVDASRVRSFASDAELDARLDTRNRLTATALHCPGSPARSAPGAGGLAELVSRPAPPAVRSGLRGVGVPVLVVRGSCDHLPAGDHRALFPQARVVTIASAGHAVHHDQPELYLDALRGFLGRSA